MTFNPQHTTARANDAVGPFWSTLLIRGEHDQGPLQELAMSSKKYFEFRAGLEQAKCIASKYDNLSQ